MRTLILMVVLAGALEAHAESRCGKAKELAPPKTKASLCTPVELTSSPTKNPDQMLIWNGNVEPTLGVAVMVLYFDKDLDAPMIKEVLDNAATRNISNAKGKLVSRKAIKLGKSPGQDLVYTSDSLPLPGHWTIHERTYAIGDRIYQLNVFRGPGAKWSRKEEARFFDSLRLATK